MTNNNQNPREYDVVLGGNNPPPVDGVVLGGVEGLQRRFETGNTQQRVDRLSDAVKYGDKGIDLLIEALDNQQLEIRVKAYELLQNIQSEKAQKSIVNGINLKVGDKVYCVYTSLPYYGDDYFYLYNEIGEYYERDYPFYKNSIDNEGKQLIYITDVQEGNDKPDYYEPQLKYIFTDKYKADKASNLLHRHELSHISCYYFSMMFNAEKQIDINEWYKEKQEFLVDLKRLDNEDYSHFEERICEYLQDFQLNEWLEELWIAKGIGNLAFTHERIVDRKCYFKPTKFFK